MARKITDVKKEGIKIPSFKLSLKCKNQKQKEFANNLKNKEKDNQLLIYDSKRWSEQKIKLKAEELFGNF